MAHRSRQRGSSAGDAGDEAPKLPAWKAFVVQFSVDTVPGSGVCAGRVEHLSSGRRARFGSQAELLAMLQRLLSEASTPST